jgi:hypothetical protein
MEKKNYNFEIVYNIYTINTKKKDIMGITNVKLTTIFRYISEC